MQKRKEGRIFGRTRNQRSALLLGLVADLVEHEKITTTVAKAKELKRVMDPIVILGKKSHDESLAVTALRRLKGLLPEKSVAKFQDKAFIKRFEGRTSGFTRVIKLEARKIDSAEMAVIEFV